MKKKPGIIKNKLSSLFFLGICFLSLVIFSSITISQEYNFGLTRSIADTLYCRLIGCTIAGDLIIEGNLTIIGDILNVSDVNVNGSLLPSIDDSYDIGSGTLRWRNANLSGFIEALFFVGSSEFLTGLNFYNIVNFTDEYSRSGFNNENFSTQLGLKNTSLWNKSGTNTILANQGDLVGIGTTTPTSKLHVSVANTGDPGITLGVAPDSTLDYTITRDGGGGLLFFQGSQTGATGYSFLSDDDSVLFIIIDNGNVGIGTTTPKTNLHVIGNINASINISAGTNIFLDGTNGFVGIGGIPEVELDIDGRIDLHHTALGNNEDAFDIIVNASGFGNVKAFEIDYIAGGLVSGEFASVFDITVEDRTSTGGDIEFIRLDKIGEGQAKELGLVIGAEIIPIRQDSGKFINESFALINETTKDYLLNASINFSTTTNNTGIFTNDNDYIYIGNEVRFSEIEFLLDVKSSKSINDIVEFSNSTGEWTEFFPIDSTGGMIRDGVFAWEAEDLVNWSNMSVAGNNAVWVRVQRTRNTIQTTPVESLIEIVVASTFTWDEVGNLSINALEQVENLKGTYVGGQANVCVTDNGRVFASDAAC